MHFGLVEAMCLNMGICMSTITEKTLAFPISGKDGNNISFARLPATGRMEKRENAIKIFVS